MNTADGTDPVGTKRWSVRRLGLIAAGALLLVWLIVRSAVVMSADADGASRLTGIVAGDSAPALIARAGSDGETANVVPDAARMSVLRKAAARSPLRFEPFFAQSLADETAGRWPQAAAAAEAARSREPRAVSVRGVLLEAYLRQRRYAEAIGELNAVVARSVEANGAIMRLLTSLADNAATAPLVQRALAGNPRWRSEFIAYAGAHAANKALLFDALSGPHGAVPEDQKRQSQTSFLNALIAAGDYQRAYLSWVNFLPPADAAKAEAIYDGDFTGLAGVPPFNWTLASNGAGTADRTRDTSLPGRSALDVQFFGGDATQLASEHLLLPAGGYTFGGIASGSNASRFGGTLTWELSCLPSGPVTVLARLTAFPPGPVRMTRKIVVPETGCTAQKLTLRGEPGDISALVQAQFTGLRLSAD